MDRPLVVNLLTDVIRILEEAEAEDAGEGLRKVQKMVTERQVAYGKAAKEVSLPIVDVFYGTPFSRQSTKRVYPISDELEQQLNDDWHAEKLDRLMHDGMAIRVLGEIIDQYEPDSWARVEAIVYNLREHKRSYRNNIRAKIRLLQHFAFVNGSREEDNPDGSKGAVVYCPTPLGEKGYASIQTLKNTSSN